MIQSLFDYMNQTSYSAVDSICSKIEADGHCKWNRQYWRWPRAEDKDVGRSIMYMDDQDLIADFFMTVM